MSPPVEPRGDRHSAAALAEFLAWPAGSVGRSRPPRRSVFASAIVCWSTCLLLGAVSFAAPLIAPGGRALALGARVLLFCHLG